MRNNLLIVGKHGRPSMKNVYSKMKSGKLLIRRTPFKGNIYYRLYENNNLNNMTRVNNYVLNSTDVIIRWGTQEQLAEDRKGIVYNKSSALALVSNKYKSRLAMAAAGVNVPLNITDATPNNSITYPVIARPHHHSKGKNFTILKNREQFLAHYRANRNGWYYSNFIDKVAEYRVHAASGKCLNLLQKPNPGGNQIAWNRAQGNDAFVSVKWDDYPIAVVLEALKACKALGCDFLGIDVIVDKAGKAWVLEGNSSPTLNTSEYSSERYAKYFDWLMRSPERREHWDFTEFTKPSSFAWKNFQLED